MTSTATIPPHAHRQPSSFAPAVALSVALAGAAFGHSASAQVVESSDRAAFLAATGATPEPEWPNRGPIPGGSAASFHLGRLTLTIAPPSNGLWIGSGGDPRVGPDWTTLVAGNDIAISGLENLNVGFDEPMTAVGFDFAEPTTVTVIYNPCSALCPCANSVFRVTLRRAGTLVGTVDFSRPDNIASFVGLTSPVPFDRMEIRELSGSCDDEYFGRFWTRSAPACVADTDDGTGTGTPDGGVGIEDLIYYLSQYDAGSLRADVDDGTGTGTPDGGVGIEDLLYYLTRYDAGC